MIKLNGVECAVSKSEAKEAEAIRFALSSKMSDSAIAHYKLWVNAADTSEARDRRLKVGVALKIQKGEV
jgi:hypothetical protein